MTSRLVRTGHRPPEDGTYGPRTMSRSGDSAGPIPAIWQPRRAACSATDSSASLTGGPSEPRSLAGTSAPETAITVSAALTQPGSRSPRTLTTCTGDETPDSTSSASPAMPVPATTMARGLPSRARAATPAS